MANDQVHVLVGVFPTEGGAPEALTQLKISGVKRGNAAVISRDDGGKLHIKETQDWGMGKAALAGAAAAIIIPGIGPLVGAALGAAAAKFTDFGFPDDTLEQLGRRLSPDSSALVLAVDEPQRPEAERVLTAAGGHVISGRLDAALAEQLGRSSAAASTSPGKTGA